MKTFRELLEAKENKEKIYILKVVGPFFVSSVQSYVEKSLNTIFVLSDSPESALKLANKNTKVITKMFQKHHWKNGEKAIEKGDKTEIRIWKGTKAEDSYLNKDNNVLTSKNKFEKVSL